MKKYINYIFYILINIIIFYCYNEINKNKIILINKRFMINIYI